MIILLFNVLKFNKKKRNLNECKWKEMDIVDFLQIGGTPHKIKKEIDKLIQTREKKKE